MKILFVEDDEHVSEFAKGVFMKTNHDIVMCQTPKCAIQALGLSKFDLIILDMNLKEGTGDQVLSHMSEHEVSTPVFIHSGYVMEKDPIIQHYKSIGIVKQVYQKPFAMFGEMLRAVNSL